MRYCVIKVTPSAVRMKFRFRKHLVCSVRRWIVRATVSVPSASARVVLLNCVHRVFKTLMYRSPAECVVYALRYYSHDCSVLLNCCMLAYHWNPTPTDDALHFRISSSEIVSVAYAGGRRSKFLARETRTRNLVQETCIQVTHRTIQVSRTRNAADDRDDKEFQILFFSG